MINQARLLVHLAVIYAVVAVPMAAHGQSSWRTIGENRGVTFQVDFSHVLVDGDFRHVWIKELFTSHKNGTQGESVEVRTTTGKLLDSITERWEFDCGTETGRSETLIVDYEDGTKSTSDPVAPKRPIPIDDVNYVVMHTICKRTN